MSSFINIDTDKVINRDYVAIHLLFLTLWSGIIGVILFRIDVSIVNRYFSGEEWLLYFSPIILLLVLYFSLRSFEWYFKLGFIFYVPLLIFWFIPKFVLQKGKFYLFISYINSIISRIEKWKSSFFHGIILFMLIVLLSNIPNNPVRIISALFALYVLIKYNYRYTISSFKPEGLLGSKTVNFFSPKKAKNISEAKRFEHFERMIKSLEKKDQTKHEIRQKQISQLVTFHTIIDSFKSNLTSSKGKISFILYWLITFAFSLVITLFLISFVNYQLFMIDDLAFQVEGNIGFGEFLRYTGKCFTYGDIVEIRPISGIAKLIEGATFYGVGIVYLMIIISFGYSFNAASVEEEKKVVIDVLDRQLIEVNDFASYKFGKEYIEIFKEISDIEDSVLKLKSAFSKMF